MKMNDTVARIVDIMFQDVEMNEEVAAIRDEVMNNCQDRYTDLMNSGMNEDAAIAAVIESLKGMEDVLAPYKRKAQHVSEDDDPKDSERRMTFSAAEIHQINVCLVNEDVCIEASDDDDYHVLWDANSNPLVQAYVQDGALKIERQPGDAVKMNKDGIEYHHKDSREDFVKTENGKIEINMNSIDGMFKSIGQSMKKIFTTVGNTITINVGFGDGGVTVQIPEAAVPQVKLLTTAGDIEVQDAALADLNVTSTSGDINIVLNEDQNPGRIELRTTSGDIEVNAFAQGLSVCSTSGDVEIEGRINTLAVSTISGDIDVRADVENVTFKAISGDVDLQFNSNEIRDVSGSTISGDIDIDLPDGLCANAINAQTRSGDVTNRYHASGAGPTVTGSVTSMSGDITIS